MSVLLVVIIYITKLARTRPRKPLARHSESLSSSILILFDRVGSMICLLIRYIIARQTRLYTILANKSLDRKHVHEGKREQQETNEKFNRK